MAQVQTATFTTEVSNVDLAKLRTACASKVEAALLDDDVWWMPSPTVTRAWFKAIGLYCFPNVNDNGFSVTYATVERSQYSASGQQINIEHGLLPNTQNPNGSPIAVGSISNLWLPWLEEGEDRVAPSYNVPVYLLASIWRKQGKEILEDFRQENLGGWKVSVELRFTEWDYYWKNQFWSYLERPELKDYIGKKYDGSPVAMICGGKDGLVEFQGFALTKNPAEKKAQILQAVASKGGKAIYSNGIVFLDCADEITASANEAIEGGSDVMDAKELAKLLDEAKKEAIQAAKLEWEKERQIAIDNAVKEALASKEKEFEPIQKELAELKEKFENLTKEKEALASENDTLKKAQRATERLEALASKNLTVPEKLRDSLKEKAKALEDAEWQKEVEMIEAWASAMPKEQKVPLVPIIPSSTEAAKNDAPEAKAFSEGAKIKVGDKEYSLSNFI